MPDTTFHLIASLFGVLPGARAGMLDEALFGAIVPAGSIWLGGWLFEKLRHKEGLGFGDVKMLAMVGAFLGIRGALLTIVLGSIAGSVVGLVFIKATGKDAGSYQLPFGSFLGAAALLAAAEGQSVIGWYMRTLLLTPFFAGGYGLQLVQSSAAARQGLEIRSFLLCFSLSRHLLMVYYFSGLSLHFKGFESLHYGGERPTTSRGVGLRMSGRRRRDGRSYALSRLARNAARSR